MVEIEIDGKKVEVAPGSMVMQAAGQLGLYVPHFCYHKKLSIAANCRMCLVEVEKAPKPLPACATPVAPGMKVWTRSPKAVQAQQGVMEFLLLNHPLDCPICDQGGECQLQDLAVGYGGSNSRYDGPKRMVFHKSMGPLVSAEEMSRCIHCTRCVRFGQEIAGIMELGMKGRGEHAEITTFVGRAVESELSGNMIDVCPVGALTSKPFRYQARTWELLRRKSVSGHDSMGANLIVQSKQGHVLRVLPYENEAVNECWISDRDRFAYEGYASAQRLKRPMVRAKDGQLHEVDWSEALVAAAEGLKLTRDQSGADQLGFVASPIATFEELALFAQLAQGLGVAHVDFRCGMSAAGFDTVRTGAPWLGFPVAELATHDCLFVIGSFLRKDHPLLAQRIRQAVKLGTSVSVLNGVDDDLLMPLANKAIVSPARWLSILAQVGVAVAGLKGLERPSAWAGVEASAEASGIAQSLVSGNKSAVLLGNAILQHPDAAAIWSAAQWLADAVGATLGFTVEGGNGVGGYLAGAVPAGHGLNAAQMFDTPRAAYVLLHTQPELDAANTAQARKALDKANFVLSLNCFADVSTREYADVILPITPFTETSGTYINCEGRVQSFQGAVPAAGESRPAWKVLRVLGNQLGLEGFAYNTSEEVLNAALNPNSVTEKLNNRCSGAVVGQSVLNGDLMRIADTPIYFSDAFVRHAESLQQTPSAAAPVVRMCGADLAARGLSGGSQVAVSQGHEIVILPLAQDDTVALGTVRLSGSHDAVAAVGPRIGAIRVEAA